MIIQVAIAILAVWFFGVMASVIMGGLIHVLLVIGFILFIIGIIEEKNPARWR